MVHAHAPNVTRTDLSAAPELRLTVDGQLAPGDHGPWHRLRRRQHR